MSDTYVISIGVSLGDNSDEIVTNYGTSGGSDYAVLEIGTRVILHVSRATPEVLDRLAEVATELAAWRRQQIADGGES